MTLYHLQLTVAVIIGCYLIVIAILKTKYVFWYDQPLHFKFNALHALQKTKMSSPLSPIHDTAELEIYKKNPQNIAPFVRHIDPAHIRMFISPPQPSLMQLIAVFMNVACAADLPPLATHALPMKLVPHYTADDLATLLRSHNDLPPRLTIYERASHVQDIRSNAVIPAADIAACAISIPLLMHTATGSKAVYAVRDFYTHTWWGSNSNNSNNKDHIRIRQAVVDTLEYAQKTTHLDAPYTLYRYTADAIPWFVVPYISRYTTHIFDMRTWRKWKYALPPGMQLIKITKSTIDILMNSLNRITAVLHAAYLPYIGNITAMVDAGVYTIYVLLTAVKDVQAIYFFRESHLMRIHMQSDSDRPKPPPSDAVLYANNSVMIHDGGNGVGATKTFVHGFINAMRDAFIRKKHHTLMIDDMAHNHIIIRDIMLRYKSSATRDYAYVAYNGVVGHTLSPRHVMMMN